MQGQSEDQQKEPCFGYMEEVFRRKLAFSHGKRENGALEKEVSNTHG